MTSLSASEAIPVLLSARATRGALARRAWLAFGLVAAATCVLAGVFVGAHSDRDQVDRAVVETVIVGVPVAVGFFAVRFPRERRFGLMLIGAGLIWSLTALASSPDSLPYSVGRVVAWLIFPLLIYLMLAFPEGRLVSGTAPASSSARSPRSSPSSTSVRRCSWRTTRPARRGRSASTRARPTPSWSSTPSRRSWIASCCPDATCSAWSCSAR